MPRTSTSSQSVPAYSCLVRKTTSAPRVLRAMPADLAAEVTEESNEQASGGVSAFENPANHLPFSSACLPHSDELYSVAMRICRNPHTAQDLVQETLLRAMCAWDSFQEGSNLRAWLFRILTNAFINGYRKRRRHQRFAHERPGDALTALYGRDQDCTDDVSTDLIGEELCDEVRAALNQLGPEYRDVVERADLRGEKYKDIAESLALPIGTVMSRLFRARRVLETELAGFAARDYGIRRAA